MFITSWYYAIVAILIAAGIYKYIEYKGFVSARRFLKNLFITWIQGSLHRPCAGDIKQSVCLLVCLSVCP